MARQLGIDRTLLRAGERVCVAVSGGADSGALLLALLDANAAKESLGVVLSAAHVHHGLRGEEADGDEAFVRELCSRIHVPLTVFRVNTAARRASEREGLEEAARELRYAALRGLMDEGKADVIATAHTLDDQAETVVMKLLRGAWTEGLGGISPEIREQGIRKQGITEQGTGNREQGRAAGRIVRPLLGVRRADVEMFLRNRGQAWREDSTNRDVSLTRNRVRHELMPVLRGFNPGIDELLANVAAIARDEEVHWAAEVGRVLSGVLLPGKPVRGGGRAVSTTVGKASCALELDRLRGFDPGLRRRVVRSAVRTLGGRLSGEETAKVLALAGFGGGTGAAAQVTGKIGSRLELGSGVRVERSARELRLSRTTPAERAIKLQGNATDEA